MSSRNTCLLNNKFDCVYNFYFIKWNYFSKIEFLIINPVLDFFIFIATRIVFFMFVKIREDARGQHDSTNLQNSNEHTDATDIYWK